MPTVLATAGLRFFFFSNEGTEPPHIHVEGRDDGYAKFWLGPVELASSVRFKAQELKQIRGMVVQYEDEFRRRWDEHFGL